MEKGDTVYVKMFKCVNFLHVPLCVMSHICTYLYMTVNFVMTNLSCRYKYKQDSYRINVTNHAKSITSKLNYG